MKILLIRPNHTGMKAVSYISFPMSLLYVGSHRKDAVRILDLQMIDVAPDWSTIEEHTKRWNPDVYGINALGIHYKHVKQLAEVLKKQWDAPIVVGGPLGTYSHQIVLEKTKVDYCVVGEGERVDFSALNGSRVIQGPDANIADFIPDYSLVDIERYAQPLMGNIYLPMRHLKVPLRKARQMEIISGRGCPYNCGYCSRPFKKRIKFRSVETVKEEVSWLKRKHDIKIFTILDEMTIMKMHEERSMLLMEALQELDINWICNVRVDQINRRLLRKAKQAGCLTMFAGIESGSDLILKNMNKGVTAKQNEEAIRMSFEEDVPLITPAILGYPGETQETIDETVGMFKRVGHPGLKVRFLGLLPGSPVYEQYRHKIEDEEKHLESLGEGGMFEVRINLSDMTDEDLKAALPETLKRLWRNYLWYLAKHPWRLIKSLRYRDFFNPVYFWWDQWKRPTDYSKASKGK